MALVPPLIASGLLVSSVRVAMVPAYVEIAHERGDLHARAFVGALVTWIAMLSVIFALILVSVPALAISVSGPGLGGSARAAAIRFLPMVAPILVLSAISMMLGVLCQVTGRFAPIAIGLLLAPLVSVAVTVGLWDSIGLDALALGLVLGEFTTLAVTLGYLARAGIIPPVRFTTERSQLSRFLKHALPLTMGSGVLQLNLLADRAVATLLSPGAVSALTYGQQIVLSPINSISYAWSIVVYPNLARAAHGGAPGSLGASASHATRGILALFVPLAVAGAALAPLLVEVAYRRGAFDARAASLTVGVAAAFAPMILVSMLQPVLTGAHNARRHGRLLASVAIANAALNLAFNVIFGLAIGVAGVALSTSFTVAILLLFLARQLEASEEGFTGRALIEVAGKALGASLLPGIPIALIVWLWLPQLDLPSAAAVLVLLAGAGLGVYLATARVVALTEPWAILHQTARQLRAIGRRAG